MSDTGKNLTACVCKLTWSLVVALADKSCSAPKERASCAGSVPSKYGIMT